MIYCWGAARARVLFGSSAVVVVSRECSSPPLVRRYHRGHRQRYSVCLFCRIFYMRDRSCAFTTRFIALRCAPGNHTQRTHLCAHLSPVRGHIYIKPNIGAANRAFDRCTVVPAHSAASQVRHSLAGLIAAVSGRFNNIAATAQLSSLRNTAQLRQLTLIDWCVAAAVAATA